MKCAPDLERRIEGFLRTFENDCKGCLYKSYCDGCRATVAKELLAELKSANGEHDKTVDSLGVRISCIIAQIKSAGRPLLGHEIVLKNCSGNLKGWTLNRMVRAKMLVKTREERRRYRYSLPEGKTNL